MTGFDGMLANYGLLIFLWVAVVTYVILARIGSRFQISIRSTLSIAAAGLPIGLVVSILTMLIIVASYNFSAFVRASAKEPLAMLAFVSETGMEFSIFTVGSIVVFAFLRLLKRRATTH